MSAAVPSQLVNSCEREKYENSEENDRSQWVRVSCTANLNLGLYLISLVDWGVTFIKSNYLFSFRGQRGHRDHRASRGQRRRGVRHDEGRPEETGPPENDRTVIVVVNRSLSTKFTNETQKRQWDLSNFGRRLNVHGTSRHPSTPPDPVETEGGDSDPVQGSSLSPPSPPPFLPGHLLYRPLLHPLRLSVPRRRHWTGPVNPLFSFSTSTDLWPQFWRIVHCNIDLSG